MVPSVKLRNFRSYENASFNFCPGINGIIGVSQSGKTNILRALRLLIFLQPAGIGFVRNKDEKLIAEVEVTTKENSTVSIKKGKGVAEYSLNGNKFRKFGRQVPDEITQALNISEINFQDQFDPPFLVTSKPSEVSKVINAATGMDDFDEWINTVNSKLRTLKAEKTVFEVELEKSLIVLDKMDGLEDVEPILFEANMFKKERLKAEKKYDRLKENYSTIQDIKLKIKCEKKVLGLRSIIDELNKVSSEIELIDEQCEVLEKYQEIKKSIRASKIEVKKRANEFIEELKNARKCPICLSPIKQSTVMRLRNEISVTK